jgi:nucleoside-triphosphatase
MRNILLTGPPGVGKTSLMRKLSEIFKEFNPAGFYTLEMREGEEQTGFEVATLFGDSRTFASTEIKSNHRVGRYRVDLKVFDKLVEEVFAKDKKTGLYMIDEIGKMVCMSKKFCRSITEALNSDMIVVATIVEKGTGTIQDIKKRKDVRLIELTPDNRDLKLKELTMEIRDLLLE